MAEGLHVSTISSPWRIGKWFLVNIPFRPNKCSFYVSKALALYGASSSQNHKGEIGPSRHSSGEPTARTVVGPTAPNSYLLQGLFAYCHSDAIRWSKYALNK